MTRAGLSYVAGAAVVAAGLLQGCGAPGGSVSGPVAQAKLSGAVHGGQQPVSGATVQLYAVGATGDGSLPTPLLIPPATTDATGAFNFSAFTCPTSTTLVYLVASGGNPGLGSGTNNGALMEMAALGFCDNLSNLTFIQMNEVTTVAAAAALAPYMTAPANVGSSASDLSGLQGAFNLAAEYADISQGTSPGAGYSDTAGFSTPGIPVAEINTLANVLASCVNTTSAASANCSQLSSLTGGAPDTLSAIVALEKNPTAYDANALYMLASSTAPFQPQLGTAPVTFGVTPQAPTGGSSPVFAFPSKVGPGDAVWAVQKVYNPSTSPCLESPYNYLRMDNNNSYFATGGTVQCGVILGYVPAGVPNGTGFVEWLTSTNSSFSPFNDYQGYLTVAAAPAPSISFKPNAVVWEGTAGAASYHYTVTLTNNVQAGQMTLGSPTFSGTDAALFTVASNSCNATLSGLNSCELELYFTPPDTGFRYATMTLPATDALGNKFYATVQLAGSGMY